MKIEELSWRECELSNNIVASCGYDLYYIENAGKVFHIHKMPDYAAGGYEIWLGATKTEEEAKQIAVDIANGCLLEEQDSPLQWVEHDPSGNLMAGDFWICEGKYRMYELHIQDPHAPDGFRRIASFKDIEEAKQTAEMW